MMRAPKVMGHWASGSCGAAEPFGIFFLAPWICFLAEESVLFFFEQAVMKGVDGKCRQ
jgi:hypothetical protein